MKKATILILAAVAGMVVISSCGRQQKKQQAAAAAEETIELQTKEVANSVHMKAEPAEYAEAPKTVKIHIHNGTEQMAQFGANYSIDHYKDGEWVEVELPMHGVIAIMYMLQPDHGSDYEVSLFSSDVTYENGLYRVRKNISVGEEPMEITAEFHIGL